jgi:hypothetical protein
MASAENHPSTPTYHHVREPIDFSYIEPLHKDDIQLIWIDRLCQDDVLGRLLHRIDPSSHSFDNFTTAVEYLSSNKNSFQFFVIVSGEFCEEMIQISEHMSHVDFVFVYCLNLAKYEYLKGKSLKLLTICDRPSELISSIEKAQRSASIAIA